ncbi:hypothetical protein [Flavihumibacter petaseus]|uniref:Uncharacterized protein n=1 Tax=Flavihumibacter petaseus NBRC 106054 TaxID=1220578 RepID=A0A0E9N6N1_9BACT|nr:hypothetical protein [Flavihumibacter petaseus]GAO45607.1 hypothetical protein FPE01S_06_00980 [Flavihumibacter petaseus NBRC 106054]
MTARTFNTLGGFQSMLFCIGIYIVALFFSIFICSAIFKAVNSRKNADITVVQPAAKNNAVQLASR